MSSSPTSEEEPVEFVSSRIIQREFNSAQIVEKHQRGELRLRVIEQRHLNRRQRAKMNLYIRTRIEFIPCTHSQTVSFETLEGAPVSLAHRYLRPDGLLAGSGMVNPHQLFLEDRLLVLERDF